MRPDRVRRTLPRIPTRTTLRTDVVRTLRRMLDRAGARGRPDAAVVEVRLPDGATTPHPITAMPAPIRPMVG
jgi:hypothetical protein